MAKRLTVFYSWQSDSESKYNRSFIEDALNKALKELNANASLEMALRDTPLELDKDTSGVAGSPPIADTILKKIDECAVFVADLSFVGVSKGGLKNSAGNARQFPNPNVLLEYGYALRSHSHNKIIGVMNDALGKPSSESLPFDLRHLRWPICYHLDGSSLSAKDQQYRNLVKTLTGAIGDVIKNASISVKSSDEIPSRQSTNNKAIYFDDEQSLFTERQNVSKLPEGAKAYLRILPSTEEQLISSELDACELACEGHLLPLGKVSSWGYDRNIYGGITFGTSDDSFLCNFTQLFLNKEIWGVDAKSLSQKYFVNTRDGYPPVYINIFRVEDVFTKAFENYVTFARSHLKLQEPLRVEAGLIGIKGYPLVSNLSVYGKSLRNEIIWRENISGGGELAAEKLTPFFDRIWRNCGLRRPSAKQLPTT